ncbi:FAD-dependent oxidoreductase [Nocardiopsis ansamitocini]|uniref:Flavoprotein oxidoreductase n=1 Tax=Nocardiopsis ansamitocini TaxID=1670832 RepID=A0A9W6UI08_9ACTN|nr:FAD-dependent oxidoreductase [Nocardiopsis ansamitocini]GLU47237.1 flavoprotein oxidoreductase [Nocardiopsis ansamitocini]
MERRVNDRPRLVVIGGDASGMSAASQARRALGPEELEILALERGTYTSYSACGIPYLVGKTVSSPEELVARTPEEFRRDFAIGVRTETEATSIDVAERLVRTVDASGTVAEEPYDHLLIATGAAPRRPHLPGADAEGVFGLRTLPDGIALNAYLDGRAPSRAVVVGGGYVGLEMAEAFLERGIEVTVVDGGAEPMGTLDADMGALVREAMQAMGASFQPHTRVTGFETEDGVVRRVLAQDAAYEADVVVMALGVRPNSDLARAAGLEIGPTGGIVVDRRMRTSAQGVWAAGDCVETFHRVSRAPVSVPLGTHANKQGRVAGTGIAGGYAAFEGVLGTAITKLCGLEVARTGLNETEAATAGFVVETVVKESTLRAGYYPGAEAVTVKLLAERGSGRLLGAQIVGGAGAGKRIDVLAVALWNEMTVHALAGMDLSYAPPFSPVWDPVQIAARKLAERMG